MAQEYNEVIENLFQAIDVIAQQKVDSLNFNKTVRCCITDDSKAELGEYTVTDGSTTFIVYSSDITYTEGTYVYVLIPNGDFTAQKTIIGKYINGTSDYYTYKKPSEYLVDITGNLFGGFDDKYLSKPQSFYLVYPETGIAYIGLTANNVERSERVIWESEDLHINEYTRLLVGAEFRTWLNKYNLSSGTYGLKFQFIIAEQGTTQTDTSKKYVTYQLSSDDMIGDVYNFTTFFNQEALIDLTKIYDVTTEYIKQIRVIFYQDNNFANLNNDLIDVAFSDNIFVANLNIRFGFDVSEFTEDTLLLYTLDTNYYATFFTEERKKFLGINDNMDLATLNSLLNKYNAKNLMIKWIHFQEQESEDGQAILNNNGIVVISNTMSMPKSSVLKWYRYHYAEGVYDSVAGPFWEEIPSQENRYFFDNFIPDITQQKEQIKAIIQYPSLKSLDNIINNDEEYVELSKIYRFYVDSYALTIEERKELAEFIEQSELFKSLSIVYENNLNNVLAEVERQKTNKEASVYGDFKTIESEILVLENESIVPDLATIDLIQGLSIEVDVEGYQGVYRIYNDTGNIISTAEATKTRILTANYTSLVTGEDELDTAERIQWIFPLSNTMIFPPEDGVEYDSKEDSVYEEDGFLFITRRGVVSSHTPGDEEIDSTQQLFRIKEYYSQSYTNNYIRCRLTKNNTVYEAIAELTFGPSGTNGTSYTLNLSFEHKENALTLGQVVTVVPTLYNYENIDISDEITDIKYSWESQNDNGGIILNEVNNTAELVATGALEDCEHYILKATVRYVAISTDAKGVSQDVTLTAYLPIPVRSSSEYISFDGADKIIYDSSGILKDYYMDPYSIYVYNINKTEKLEGVTWEMSYGSDTTAYGDGLRYYPQVSSTGVLTPCSLFLQDNGKQISVRGYYNGSLIWVQPIRIYQYVYTSALLNSWDGSLTTDEENGIILSTMIGAGFKDDENRFNGVLMGDVASAADDMADDIGIYGYHEGVQSFGWLIDGTGFIGKKGKGQILFNGNDGTIQSANFEENDNGMKIDLNEGILTARHGEGEVIIDPTGEDGYYFKITSLTGNDLLYIGDDDYYLQTNDFDDDKETGTSINLSEGRIVSYNFELETKNLRISADGDPLFGVFIKDPDNLAEEKYLIKIGHNEDRNDDDEFYLQSANFKEQKRRPGDEGYNSEVDDGHGLKLDLQNGYLEGYNFRLFISSSSDEYLVDVDITKDETRKVIVRNDYFKRHAGSFFLVDSNIDSDDSPFFQVHWVDGNRVDTETIIDNDSVSVDDGSYEEIGVGEIIGETAWQQSDLIKITPKQYYLNSPDYQSRKVGMAIDLTEGALGVISESKARVLTISKKPRTFPLYIKKADGTGKVQAGIRWDGRLFGRGLLLAWGKTDADTYNRTANVYAAPIKAFKQIIRDAYVSSPNTLTITIDEGTYGFPIAGKKPDAAIWGNSATGGAAQLNADDAILFCNKPGSSSSNVAS